MDRDIRPRLRYLVLYLLPCIHVPFVAAAADGPDAEVQQFRLDELEASLPTMQPGTEHDYFAGLLANRTGHIEESIRLLNEVLPAIRGSQPLRAEVALEALADDYNKSFRYFDAARTYDDLLTHFAAQVDRRHLQGTKDDAGVVRLLRDAPPQSISGPGAVRLKTVRNAIGSLNTELTVNGVREAWLLDTGANQSAVSGSFARRLGLTPLPGYGQTTAGITGVENRLQVAIVPTMQLGGATLHNVVVLILDDANLKVEMGKEAYQINAIIGYPVFQALGVITFLQGGWLESGDTTRRHAGGARMFMKLLMPVIECGVAGTDLPFALDTGATGSNFSIRYYERFRTQDRAWTKSETKSFGAGGIRRRVTYLQPRVSLKVGDRTATLERVPVFRTKMGSDIDELYGNLGQDLVAKFESFTLDFANMTFSLGAPLP